MAKLPSPSWVIAIKRAGASPAAGPLMVTNDPPRNGKRSPAMIDEIKPAIGGAPEATAMPNDRGSDVSETISPATMSYRQCFSPARPLLGFSITTACLPGSNIICLSLRAGEARFEGSGVARATHHKLARDVRLPGPWND